MPSTDQPSFDLAISPLPRRRGRPAGAKNRRSIDLARYIEATFAGMTPGQQAAQLCMITPKELREAKQMAQSLDLHGIGTLPAPMLAMVVKAAQLAAALGCERKEAWLLLQKERAELMPYVHQKRAQAADDKGDKPVLAYMIPDDSGPMALPDAGSEGDPEAIEIFGDLPDAANQVSQAKSHDHA